MFGRATVNKLCGSIKDTVIFATVRNLQPGKQKSFVDTESILHRKVCMSFAEL